MRVVYSQGDIIRFDPNPSIGHEPRGRRPATIVSFFEFNASKGMSLVCPITTTLDRFPLQ